MANSWHLILGVSYVFTFVSIVLICVAMATDYWVEYDVNRSALRRELISDLDLHNQLFTYEIYWTRHRGLFRICYTDFEFPTYFPESGKTNGDVICYEEDGYDFDSADNITSIDPSNDAKDDYKTRNHLLRSVCAMFALCLACNVIGFSTAIVGTCKRVITSVTYAAVWTLIAAVFAILAMGMFHGVHVMESDTIKSAMFKAGWSSLERHSALEQYTDINFGYSYILGWTAAGSNLFAALLYFFAAYSLAEFTRNLLYMTTLMNPYAKNQLAKDFYNTKAPPMASMYGYSANETVKQNAADEFFVGSGGRNKAYDYVDEFANIEGEDRPGENEEVNKQIKRVPLEDTQAPSRYPPGMEKPESWYNDRKYESLKPPSQYNGRSNTEDIGRIPRPYGYGQKYGPYGQYYY